MKFINLLALGATVTLAAPSKLDLLRRAILEARTPQYDSVPYKIDSDYCVWQPGKGECWMNIAVDKIYEVLKYDPPDYSQYDWYNEDYKSDEGVYAYDDYATEEYQYQLIDLYDVVNKHYGYDGYDYDYADYIEKYENEYCVWEYDGKCWTNDVITYVDKIWDVTEPKYDKKDSKDWAVYATSKGIQTYYATVCYDLLVSINKWGPLDYDWADANKTSKA